MKKLLFIATSIAALFFAASCQQENLEPEMSATSVTYTVEVPQVETKAIGDGENVNQLIYEVWRTAGKDDKTLTAGNGTERLYVAEAAREADGKFRFTVDLVQDQNYTILFWAQVKDAGYYDTKDLRNVTFSDGKKLVSNNETRAAFYGIDHIDGENPKASETVELTRPFAQINLGSVLRTAEQDKIYKLTADYAFVKVTGAATSFNVATATAGEETTTWAFGKAEDPSETLTVNKTDYDWVAMNYIFVPKNQATVTVDYTIYTNHGDVTNTVLNVPVQKNYRTNIVGNLLTSKTEYTVELDTDWGGNDYYGPEFVMEPKKDDAGNYMITNKYELLWLAAAVNGTLPGVDTKIEPSGEPFEGKTFKLSADIDLQNMDWTPIGAKGTVFLGTFDGNGKTISNLNVSTEGKASAGLFAAVRNVKNLTVKNATISGQYKTGVISGDGLCARIENCHVDGATVTSTPYNNDDANHVGGIVGYLSAEPTAYVKNCSVKNASITGFRDVAGIAGTANQAAVVTGNRVENVTVTSDQTANYVDNTKDGNAGAIVGRIHAKATVDPNTVGENVVVIRKVDSTEEMAYAVAEAQNGETIYVGNGEVALPHFENKALNFVGAHDDAAILEPVSSHIDAFWQGSELNFTDLKIKGTSYTGKANGYVKSAKETYTGCSFVDGYYMFAGDEAIVNDCVFTGKYNSYFWTGSADAITFNKCEFNGVERIVKVCTVGHTGVEREVTFNSCQFTATEQKKAAIEIDGTKGSSYIVNINYCTETGFAPGEFTGETLFNIEKMENAVVYVDGTIFEPSYVVKGNTYEVYAAAGLAKWAYMANNVDNTLNLKLMKDIVLPAFEIEEDDVNKTYVFTETPITVENGVPSGSNWVPVGNYDEDKVAFKGHIDGKGHTISNMYINSAIGINTATTHTGFVGRADGGDTMESAVDYENIYIEAVTIKDAVIYSETTTTAAVAGYIRNIKGISECHVINSSISGADYTAGITGYNYTRHSDNKVVVNGCSVDALTVVNGAKYVGGIVAFNYGSIVINCSNAASVTGSDTYVGGIVGYTRDYHHYRSAYIMACQNSGDVTGIGAYVGGIAGYNLFDVNHTNSESCIVACSSTASKVVKSILVGKAYANSSTVINEHHYGSWGLKTSSVSDVLSGGEMVACYAFESAADITQAEVDAMNAAIDTYNAGRAVTDPTYCPYKWAWTPGTLPVLQK